MLSNDQTSKCSYAVCLEVKLMYFESVSKILGKNTTEKDDIVVFFKWYTNRVFVVTGHQSVTATLTNIVKLQHSGLFCFWTLYVLLSWFHFLKRLTFPSITHDAKVKICFTFAIQQNRHYVNHIGRTAAHWPKKPVDIKRRIKNWTYNAVTFVKTGTFKA